MTRDSNILAYFRAESFLQAGIYLGLQLVLQLWNHKYHYNNSTTLSHAKESALPVRSDGRILWPQLRGFPVTFMEPVDEMLIIVMDGINVKSLGKNPKAKALEYLEIII
jgi:hypothetical protein